ncbi:hypothetical protein JX265_012117 [Neoarthrinium moseri]|uniref:Uncharacterized protein n=1 Tax=Neoarthrinium moseri TaxID=1658444 RepID=A0A9Q0AH15_9PEZI|nr:uncharacterized protein JN550_001329 [Neoarthrinium moseri]KAI1849322.1 hypothetical protein JX266_004817 [Neoarthrinium moseri]KAI1855854.1 hypothetical protein JX265_012117 [Neoarthrinium moseri]KAI1877257.1 hypothetical protein JN550_001329 [Neoarthrinium moseri]
MKFLAQTAVGSAALLLAAQPCLASFPHRHNHLGRRHSHEHNNSIRGVAHKDRSLGTCSFPDGEGLVAITPHKDNAGWALSPDQFCTCGSYCPYACPPGQVMAQWKDGSTYGTTDRMAGGLFCGLDGKAVKPFSNKPLCVDGTGTVSAVNKVGKVVSFCQTVLPGNEDIIIPTDVHDTQVLAVPDPSYWQSTASHFYINPPGVDSDKGCHWGDESQPIGNWAPYVAGANTDSSGSTFVKLGLNPIWQGSSLFGTKPSFGMKIECPSGNCVGLPCSIDGNGVTSNLKATGAGDSDFCVVTVPKGKSANIVVYNLDGSSGSTTSAAPPTTSSKPQPTTTSTTPTTSATPTTSSTPTSTSVPSTSSKASSTSHESSSSSYPPSSSSASAYSIGGIFQENGTSTSAFSWVSASSTPTSVSGSGSDSSSAGAASATESSKNESSAAQGNGAIAGLIVAFIAAACLL